MNKEGEYAKIHELCLHESTRIDTKHVDGKNTRMVFERIYQVTRVQGGWLYSRMTGSTEQETFIPDTRRSEIQTRANNYRV